MSILRSSLRGALFAVASVAYAASAGAQCEVTGRTVICPDSTVELCAPPSGGYRWVDENGTVISTQQCITINAPAVFRVYTYDAGMDVWWGPCVHSVSAAPPESCAAVVPPPPPPPPPTPPPGTNPPPTPPPAPRTEMDTLACPRPASWWARQCRRDGDRHVLLDAASVAAVAQCVDERGAVFAWADAGSGFCRAIRASDNADLRQRTLRQYAAVLANLCATQAAMAQRGGTRFGLGPDVKLAWSSTSRTVGEWASAAGSELASLQGASLKDKRVKGAYRRIFTEAWEIGHGVGMKTSCPVPQDGEGEDSSVLAALGPDATDAADLAPVATPNPFHGAARLTFTVPDAAGADVELAVFDVAGRRMASLARGWLGAGPHVLQWDGRGLDGARARAGMYFVRGRIGQAEVTTSIMKIE
jgi:hypothetical protein